VTTEQLEPLRTSMNRRTIASTFVLMTFMTVAAGLVGGCSHNVWKDQPEQLRRDYYVPPSAQTVGEGTEKITFTAPKQGQIYVMDLDQPMMITSTDGKQKIEAYKILFQVLLLQGNEYFFDPRAGQAGILNGNRPPSRVSTVPGHRYRAMFDTVLKGEEVPG